MKVKYFLLFFLVLIIDYLLFLGFTQTFWGSNFPDFWNNPLIGLSIFAVIFLLIPGVTAYLITKRSENGFVITSNKNSFPFFILLPLLFGLLIIFAPKGGFDPYTLVGVSEDELQDLDEIYPAEERNINGITYQIFDSQDGESNLYKLVDGQKQLVWNMPIPHKSDEIADFWFDADSNTILFVESKPRGIIKNIYSYSQTSNGLDYKHLAFKSDEEFSEEEILKYYPEQKRLVLLNSRLLGCGGVGKVWLIDILGTKKDIQDYATGCAKPELPRYVGFTDELLIFAGYNPDVSSDKSTVVQLFSIDPLSMKKAMLLDRQKMPKDIVGIQLNPEDNNILRLSSSTGQTLEYDIKGTTP